MKIGRVHSGKKVWAQLLLLGIPTVLLAFYLLWNVNQYYSVLENKWLLQGCYFAAGLGASLVFYGYRFRFITTALVLFLIYFIIYKTLGRAAVGEFDAFFASVQFFIFALLSGAGWLSGFGFSRSRYFTVFWSMFLLALQVFIVSKSTTITASAVISAFAPVLLYAFFVIYTAELIRNMNEDEPGFAGFVAKRLAGFTGLSGVLLVVLLLFFQKDFKAIETDWGGTGGGKGKGGKESMTKENRDGTMSNKDQMRITGSLSKDKRLVFVAKLDNYFPDGSTPNPLYFTSLYYTKFDTLTQTFETDDRMPANDLFKPDPSKIPLYFTQVDTAVIRNAGGVRNRKIVSAEVYKVLLSPDEYLAPSTAFFVQPIPVETAFKDQFKSAYRAKMWVSDLNSAYFIYNPAGNPMLDRFQQQRFEELRQAPAYNRVDKDFMRYYTFMPPNQEYQRITNLAQQITREATTPVDKMIAIRDYFLSKDEYGQPRFKYSDNPGVPGLPSASKLNYFLFENRKGYCAYYAGATLFMLRALGIPSRIAAGFLTVDRSNKNPGWYWFYADQAHAWVQVYFPGYGWIDFDTTVPDVNTQQSPQPDGTPPLGMQKAYLVADGKAVSVDTATNRATMQVKKLLYHDKDYTAAIPKDMLMDVSIATITRDTGTARLADVKPGTDIVSVSYSIELKDVEAAPLDTLALVVDRLAKPVPIDEIKIMEASTSKQEAKKQADATSKPFDWVAMLWTVLIVLLAFGLLLLASPWLIWQYLNARAKRNAPVNTKAYNVYTAGMYYLNQLGYHRQHQSVQQFAALVDAQMGTGVQQFTNVYQQVKYSSIPLSAQQQQTVEQFYKPFKTRVRQHIPAKIRVARFLNIYNTLRYFTTTK